MPHGPSFAIYVDRASPTREAATEPMIAVAMRFEGRRGLTAFLVRRLASGVSPQVRTYGPCHRDRGAAYHGKAVLERDTYEDAVYVSRYWRPGSRPSLSDVLSVGKRLFTSLQTVVQLLRLAPADENVDTWDRSNADGRRAEERNRVAVEVALRPAQARLRSRLLSTWGRCAISGETSEQALEAAHIVPFAARGGDDVHNAILLRADLALTRFDGHPRSGERA
jgi:HNH endonuclease